MLIYNCLSYIQRKDSSSQSKKEGKDQESIQSSTTPDPGDQRESDNLTIRNKKQEPKDQHSNNSFAWINKSLSTKLCSDCDLWRIKR